MIAVSIVFCQWSYTYYYYILSVSLSNANFIIIRSGGTCVNATIHNFFFFFQVWKLFYIRTHTRAINSPRTHTQAIYNTVFSILYIYKCAYWNVLLMEVGTYLYTMRTPAQQVYYIVEEQKLSLTYLHKILWRRHLSLSLFIIDQLCWSFLNFFNGFSLALVCGCRWGVEGVSYSLVVCTLVVSNFCEGK